jgi:intracellular protein transport protein USO1
MRPLLVLAFDPKIPLQVSGRALKCLGGLIWSNGQDFSREKLAISPLTAGPAIKPPFSPLMGAILLALHGNPTEEASEQRNRALELVEAFCFNNPEGQLVLLSTLKGSQSVDSPGTAILDALFDLDTPRKRDPWHCWYASALLCNLIDGNEDAKRTLFQHQISNEDDGIEDSSDILTELMLNLIRITRDSRGSTCQKSIVGYLQLLVVWLHESPSSIKNFLHEGSYVQYLIERITTQSFSQDTEIQGLCSLILGICVLFNDESITTFGSEALKGIIKNRIGPDLYLNRLARLKAEKVPLNSLQFQNFI